MKTIIGLIKIVLVFAFMALAFVLLVNKTFVYEKYQDEEMKSDGIPISRFMYFTKLSNDLNANFISPLSANYLKKYKNDYLDGLKQCYGKYYYDEANDITVLKYDVIDLDYYRSVNIQFAYDNYCSDEYILSDMWVYEYNELSEYVNGDILESKMVDIIKKIYESTRNNDAIINDKYKSEIEIKVNCRIEDENYILTFKDFSENELLIIKEEKGVKQFAIYNVENVKDFLNSLLNQ